MKKIVLAGATGYLGSYILSELLKQGYQTTAIVRNENKIDASLKPNEKLEILKAEVTDPKSLEGSCANAQIVISTIGITKQKEGLTYHDVDYQANVNLLNEAKKQGVQKFIYISVLNGEKLKNLAICNAKEKFVSELKNSGLTYCIVRPNGFFSDMAEFFKMAKRGRIFLFGDGSIKSNPIHGADLAKECVRQIKETTPELKIGGPETLTQNEIAVTAFRTIKQEPKITHIPDGIRKLLLRMGKIFMSQYAYGPFEFFMTVMSMDMVAPEYGIHTLKEYFDELNAAE